MQRLHGHAVLSTTETARLGPLIGWYSWGGRASVVPPSDEARPTPPRPSNVCSVAPVLRRFHRACPLTRPVLALALAHAAGCFVDEEPEGDSASTGEGATSEASTTEITGAAESSDTTSSSASASAASSSTTSDTDTSSTAAETTASSTTEAPAVCGNGVLEADEACDDGNSSDLDACLSTCALASCRDGVRSQDETDVDCGGSCPACGPCGACYESADCAVGECAKNGRCVVTFTMTIDYILHCTEPDAPSKNTTLKVPSGAYTATATPGSAGSVWSPPYTPPTEGWSWRAPCIGVDFTQMRTPSDVYYATQAEAFTALIAPSEAFTVTGDLLECGLTDSVCSDNQGSVTFSARSLCE